MICNSFANHRTKFLFVVFTIITYEIMYGRLYQWVLVKWHDEYFPKQFDRRLFADTQLHLISKTYLEARINAEYLSPFRGINRSNVERLLPSNLKLNNAQRHLSCERFFIMRDFERWMQRYKIKCRRFASINGPDPEDVYLNCSESKIYYTYKENANGSDGKFADLYVLNLAEHQKMDFWSVQQTLEHIYDGHLVLKRLFQNSVCGGHIFISVPIYNIPHVMPLHFYGYTPMGILTATLQSGWEIMDLGMWGNREYLIQLLRTASWTTLFQALDAQEKSNYTRDFFVNDPFHGFQVWLLGVKNCSAISNKN